MNVRAAIFASIPFLLIAASPLANTFQMQDTSTLDALKKRVFSANYDNIAAARSLVAAYRFDEAGCLNEINHDLDSLRYEISEISTLIAISASMAIPIDESTVIGYLRLDITSAAKLLSLSRQSINNQAAFCGSSAIVVSRA